MGSNNGALEFTIRARNEANGALDEFDSRVNRARRGAETFAGQTRETTQTFKAMTTGLLSELNPALAQSVDRMSMAAREARALTPAMGGITVAAAAAAVAVGAMVQALNEGAKFTVDLNRAVKGLDLGALRSMAADVSSGMAMMAERSKTALGSIQNFITQGITGVGILLGVTETYEQRLLRLRDAYEKVFPKQAAVEIQTALIQRLQTEQKLLEVQRQRAVERGDEESVRSKNEAIAKSVENIATAEIALTNKIIDARKAAELVVAPFSVVNDELEKVRRSLQGVNAEQTKLAKASEAIAGEKLLRDMSVDRLQTLRQLVIVGNAFTETQQDTATGSKIVLTYSQAALPVIDAAIVAELKKKNVLAAQAVELQLQIEAHGRLVERISLGSAAALAGLEQQKLGAAALQRTMLDLAQIEERRTAALNAVRDNDPNAELKRQQINAQAALDRAKAQFETERRFDFATGISQGFKETVDQMRSFGDAGADMVRNFAQTSERALSDLLFLPAQQGWKKTFEELPRQVMMSMFRIVTDTFSRLAIGTLLGGGSGGGGFFGSALNIAAGGGGGGGLGSLLNVGGTAASGVGLLPAGSVIPDGYNVIGSTQIGGENFSLLSRAPSPTSLVSGYLTQGAEWAIGAAAGYLGAQASAYGQAYIAALKAGESMVSAASAASVAAEVAGSPEAMGAGLSPAAAAAATYTAQTLARAVQAGATAAELQALGASGAEIAAATSTSSSSSMFGSLGQAGSFGSYAAIAARAFQDTRWFASNRGYSGEEQLLYGLHGAGMGLADFWTGGLAELGPLLGGVIGGDFGRFLQYGLFSFVRPSVPRRVREAISVRDVLVPASNEFITRINGATTPEELFGILVQGGSGYTGGTTRLAIRTWVNGKIIGTDLGVYAGVGYATVDDLLDSSSSLVVQTNYGVSQHFLDSVNAAVEAAITAKVAQFNAILGQGTVGYIEPLEGGAVTRSTVEPLGSDVSRLRGLDLYTQTRKDLAAFFNDDNLAESFLRRLAQVDRDLATGFLNTEDFAV